MFAAASDAGSSTQSHGPADINNSDEQHQGHGKGRILAVFLTQNSQFFLCKKKPHTWCVRGHFPPILQHPQCLLPQAGLPPTLAWGNSSAVVSCHPGGATYWGPGSGFLCTGRADSLQLPLLRGTGQVRGLKEPFPLPKLHPGLFSNI